MKVMLKRTLLMSLLVLMLFSLTVVSIGAESYTDDTAAVADGAIVRIGDAGTGTYYKTLQEAYDAATAGSTITLIVDASGAGLVINKSLTIDFGGYAYSFTEGVGSSGTTTNGLQILQGNTVTLKNGELNVAEASADKFYILVQNYADLTVTDMVLDGTNLDKYAFTDTDSYVLSNNCGTVSINGATSITANNDGAKAYALDAYKSSYYEAPVVTVNTTGTISGRVEVTGGTMNVEAGSFTGEHIFWVSDGALNISGGEITASGCGIVVKGGETTISGGSITATGEYGAIQSNGSADAGNVTITGGEISAPNATAIYWPSNSALTITGGTVTGHTGVYVKSGTVTISGDAVIEATGEKAEYQPNGNGNTNTGDALVVENPASEGYEDVAVSVTGGTFTSANGSAIASYAETGETAVSGFVTGGTFNGDVPEDVASAIQASIVRDGKELTFLSLLDAINAAKDGETVTIMPGTYSELIAPWANDPTHACEKSITLEGAADFATILTGGLYLGYDDSHNSGYTVTVKGIAFEGKGVVVAGQATVIIEGNKFSNITECVTTNSTANANAISVVGKEVVAVVKDNAIDGVAVAGINLRNTKSVEITNNTVTNTGHNAITVQNNGTTDAIVITNNKLSNWGLDGEGRAIRTVGGSKVTINNDIMTCDAAPEEFVKITGSTTVDASKNYWNGENPRSGNYFATDLTCDPVELLQNYYTDANLNNNVTIPASVARIDYVYYVTLQDAVDAAVAGDTVHLLCDTSTTDKLIITKNITITGMGHTYQYTGTSGYAIQINDAITTTPIVTFKNITIVSDTGAIEARYTSNVTIDSSTVIAGTVGIYIGYSGTNTQTVSPVLNVTGSYVCANAVALYKTASQYTTFKASLIGSTFLVGNTVQTFNAAMYFGSSPTLVNTVNIQNCHTSVESKVTYDEANSDSSSTFDYITSTTALILGGNEHSEFVITGGSFKAIGTGILKNIYKDPVSANSSIVLMGSPDVTIDKSEINCTTKHCFLLENNSNITLTLNDVTARAASSLPTPTWHVIGWRYGTNGTGTVTLTVDQKTKDNAKDNASSKKPEVNWQSANNTVKTTDKEVTGTWLSKMGFVLESADNVTWSIVSKTPDATNETTGWNYSTLTKALEEASAGDTITLKRNVQVSTAIIINQNITINGDGYAITSTVSNSAVTINGNSATEVTIKDITIVAPNAEYVIARQTGTTCLELFLKNVTLTDTFEDSRGIYVGGVNTDITIHVEGICFFNVDTAIYMTQYVSEDATVDLSKYSNPSMPFAVECKLASKVNRHTTYYAFVDSFEKALDYTYSANPTAVKDRIITLFADVRRTESLIVSEGTATYQEQTFPTTLTINGNGHTLTSTASPAFLVSGDLTVNDLELNGVNEMFMLSNKAILHMTGNNTVLNAQTIIAAWDDAKTVTTDTISIAQALNADGKALVEENGVWTIVSADPEAAIDGWNYATLQNALDAATAGQTVDLLVDLTTDTTLTVDTAVTLNGNGHTVTSTAGTAVFDVKADLTVEDITVYDGTAFLLGADASLFVAETATLNVTTVLSGYNGQTIETASEAVANALNAEGYALTANAGVWNVITDAPEASVMGWNYVTFEDAYAVVSANGGTVTLLRDVTVEETIAVSAPVIIKGAYTLTSTADTAITVSGNAALSLNDLTIVAGDVLTGYTDQMSFITNMEAIANAVNDEGYAVVEANGAWTISAATPAITIADKNYATMEEALADAEDGDVLVLNANIVLSNTLTVNSDITINGNGFAITSAADTVFAVNSTLTLTNVTVNTDEAVAFELSTAAELYLNADVAVNTTTMISGYTGQAIVTKSADLAWALNDEGFVLQATATLISEEVLYTVVSNAPVAAIDGWNYASLQEALNVATAGQTVDLLVNITVDSALNVATTVTINGAGFSVTSNATNVFDVTAALTLQSITVYGDTAFALGTGASLMIADTAKLNVTTILSGYNGHVVKTSNKAVATALNAANYSLTADAGIWTVVSNDPEAQINGWNYATLLDAIKAASDGQTVDMLRDVHSTSNELNITTDITLDGHGFTLTSDISGGATLRSVDANPIIRNLTITAMDDTTDTVVIKHDGGSSASITLDGCTIISNDIGVYLYLTKGGKVSITNTTIESGSYGVYAKQSIADLLLSTGTVIESGKHGVRFDGSKINATLEDNVKITTNENGAIYVAGDSDDTIKDGGSKITIKDNVDLNGKNFDIYVTGAGRAATFDFSGITKYAAYNSFKRTNSSVVYHFYENLADAMTTEVDYQNEATGTVTLLADVTGFEGVTLNKSIILEGNGHVIVATGTAFTLAEGTDLALNCAIDAPVILASFNGQIVTTNVEATANKLNAQGYSLFEKDGVWTVTSATPAAQLNGRNYATIQEAVDAAVNGDVIYIINDCTTDTVVIDVAVTINGNGHTVTTEADAMLDVQANLTLTEVTLEATKDALTITSNVNVNISGNTTVTAAATAIKIAACSPNLTIIDGAHIASTANSGIEINAGSPTLTISGTGVVTTVEGFENGIYITGECQPSISVSGSSILRTTGGNDKHIFNIVEEAHPTINVSGNSYFATVSADNFAHAFRIGKDNVSTANATIVISGSTAEGATGVKFDVSRLLDVRVGSSVDITIQGKVTVNASQQVVYSVGTKDIEFKVNGSGVAFNSNNYGLCLIGENIDLSLKGDVTFNVPGKTAIELNATSASNLEIEGTGNGISFNCGTAIYVNKGNSDISMDGVVGLTATSYAFHFENAGNVTFNINGTNTWTADNHLVFIKNCGTFNFGYEGGLTLNSADGKGGKDFFHVEDATNPINAELVGNFNIQTRAAMVYLLDDVVTAKFTMNISAREGNTTDAFVFAGWRWLNLRVGTTSEINVSSNRVDIRTTERTVYANECGDVSISLHSEADGYIYAKVTDAAFYFARSTDASKAANTSLSITGDFTITVDKNGKFHHFLWVNGGGKDLTLDMSGSINITNMQGLVKENCTGTANISLEGVSATTETGWVVETYDGINNVTIGNDVTLKTNQSAVIYNSAGTFDLDIVGDNIELSSTASGAEGIYTTNANADIDISGSNILIDVTGWSIDAEGTGNVTLDIVGSVTINGQYGLVKNGSGTYNVTLNGDTEGDGIVITTSNSVVYFATSTTEGNTFESTGKVTLNSDTASNGDGTLSFKCNTTVTIGGDTKVLHTGNDSDARAIRTQNGTIVLNIKENAYFESNVSIFQPENNATVTFNISGGTFKTTGSQAMFRMDQAGTYTFNITGGNFTAAADCFYFTVETDLSLLAGEFNVKTLVALSNVSPTITLGGDLLVTNASLATVYVIGNADCKPTIDFTASTRTDVEYSITAYHLVYLPHNYGDARNAASPTINVLEGAKLHSTNWTMKIGDNGDSKYYEGHTTINISGGIIYGDTHMIAVNSKSTTGGTMEINMTGGSIVTAASGSALYFDSDYVGTEYKNKVVMTGGSLLTRDGDNSDTNGINVKNISQVSVYVENATITMNRRPVTVDNVSNASTGAKVAITIKDSNLTSNNDRAVYVSGITGSSLSVSGGNITTTAAGAENDTINDVKAAIYLYKFYPTEAVTISGNTVIDSRNGTSRVNGIVVNNCGATTLKLLDNVQLYARRFAIYTNNSTDFALYVSGDTTGNGVMIHANDWAAQLNGSGKIDLDILGKVTIGDPNASDKQNHGIVHFGSGTMDAYLNGDITITSIDTTFYMSSTGNDNKIKLEGTNGTIGLTGTGIQPAIHVLGNCGTIEVTITGDVNVTSSNHAFRTESGAATTLNIRDGVTLSGSKALQITGTGNHTINVNVLTDEEKAAGVVLDKVTLTATGDTVALIGAGGTKTFNAEGDVEIISTGAAALAFNEESKKVLNLNGTKVDGKTFTLWAGNGSYEIYLTNVLSSSDGSGWYLSSDNSQYLEITGGTHTSGTDAVIYSAGENHTATIRVDDTTLKGAIGFRVNSTWNTVDAEITDTYIETTGSGFQTNAIAQGTVNFTRTTFRPADGANGIYTTGWSRVTLNLRDCDMVSNKAYPVNFGGGYTDTGKAETVAVLNIYGGSYVVDGADAAIHIYDYAEANLYGGYFESHNTSVVRAWSYCTMNIYGGYFFFNAPSQDNGGSCVRVGGGTKADNIIPTINVYGGNYVSASNAGPIFNGIKDNRTLNLYDVNGNLVTNKNGKPAITARGGSALVVNPGKGTPTIKYEVSNQYFSGSVPTRVNGAQIRFATDGNGIRFATTISKDTIKYVENLIDEGTAISYGTIILPKDYLLGDDLTTTADNVPFNHHSLDLAKIKYLDIPASNGLQTDSSGNVIIRAAITNLKPTNYDRSFSAIGYIKYTVGGVDCYFYSNFDEFDNSRSMKQLAERALEDVSTTQNVTYRFPVGDGTFSRYTETQRETLLAYYDPATENNKVIDLYLIAGQSNGSGYSAFNDQFLAENANYTEGYKNVYYSGNGAGNTNIDGVPLQIPHVIDATNVVPGFGRYSNEFGAELGLADILNSYYDVDNGTAAGIVKYAVGGTSLRDNITGSDAPEGNWCSPSWIEMLEATGGSIKDENRTGALYYHFLNQVENAIAQYKTLGYNEINIKGMFWMQGESDRTAGYNHYANMLKYFITDIRKDLGELTNEDLSEMPFVVGSISESFGRDFNEGSTKFVEMQYRLPELLQDENIYVIDSSVLATSTSSSDTAHWTCYDMLLIGQMVGTTFANIYAEELGIEEALAHPATMGDAVAEVYDAEGNLIGSYSHLAYAINSAPEGATIKLLTDFNLHSALNIANKNKITIDGQGHKIETDRNSDHVIRVIGGDVTFENLDVINTIDTTSSGYCLYLYDGAKVTINSGYWEAYCHVIVMNVAGCQLTINGGEFVTRGSNDPFHAVIFSNNAATITLNGGTFTAAGKGSVLRAEGASIWVINDGTFTSAQGVDIFVKNAAVANFTLNGGTYSAGGAYAFQFDSTASTLTIDDITKLTISGGSTGIVLNNGAGYQP